MDMNARAFDLGMRDTWFTSPRGTPTPATPPRQIWDGSAVLWRKRQRCSPISGRGGISCGEKPRNWSTKTPFPYRRNQHRLQGLSQRSGGWSIAAGARRNGMQCVAVVLGCGDTDSRFTLAKQLLRKASPAGSGAAPAVRRVPLSGTSPRRRGTGSAGRGRALKLVVPRSCTELETVMVLPRFVQAPVRKGRSWGMPRSIRGTRCYMKLTWRRLMQCRCGTSGTLCIK